jgi:amidase/6-aminohexanoate-cyclic-dimer hydrolase
MLRAANRGNDMAAFKEYPRCDATELARLIDAKQVKPEEVLEAALARAEALNKPVNAITHRMDDAARQAVKRGPPDGPFRGVPFLLKDLYAYDKGQPVSNGSRFWRGFVPDHDTTLVERCKAAGLVVIGRTNTPELGLTMTTEPVALGVCRNPWNRERSAGGSSGGSAAAVALRIVPFAHATDGGGSIRIPSANCGLVGLKPTRARNPAGPDMGEGWSGMATAHCVSVSVRDSAALLDATHGPAPGDPYAAPRPERPFHEEVGAPPGSLRIGLVTAGPDGARPHKDCVAAAVEAAKLCGELGHRVEETELKYDTAAFQEAIWVVIAANVANILKLRAKLVGREAGPNDAEPLTLAAAKRAAGTPSSEYARAILTMHGFGRQVARMFEKFDVLLSPVLANPPLPLGRCSMQTPSVDEYARELAAELPFTPIYNVAGCPAISLPLHWNAEGLPVGVQFGAGFGQEAVLFRLAAQLEQARPWKDRIPPGC